MTNVGSIVRNRSHAGTVVRVGAGREDLALLSSVAEVLPKVARLQIKCAKEVEPVSVEWLWPGWLPYGKLVAFDGAPGIGKSTIAIDLIARATIGGPMPDSVHRFEPIGVMIAGVEDGWADTVRPRLDAANADLERTFFVDVAQSGGRNFTIPNDLVELVEHAVRLGVRWLHVDAIMGTLSDSTNAYSDHEVRRALGPLKEFAESHGLLVTFIRHPRKNGGTGLTAGGGSVAFGAIARIGLFAGFDPTDKQIDPAMRRRVLAVSKNNLAVAPSARLFSIVSGENSAGRIEWGETTTLSADDLAAPVAPNASDRKVNNCQQTSKQGAEVFLETLLAGGKQYSPDEVKARARANGLSWRTVERAASNIGVSKRRQGFQETSLWTLPTIPVDSLPVPPIAPPALTSTIVGGTGETGAGSSIGYRVTP